MIKYSIILLQYPYIIIILEFGFFTIEYLKFKTNYNIKTY